MNSNHIDRSDCGTGTHSKVVEKAAKSGLIASALINRY